MRNYTWAAIAILAVLICIAQQAWIFHQRQPQAPPSSAMSPPPPPVTYDVKMLAGSLRVPHGAKGLGDEESHQLQGNSYGNTGFEACLWIDIAGVEFQGRAKGLREERVALIAAFYAKQIVTLVPGAVIEAAIEQPGMAEAGSLHTTCLVRHPSGRIVVSAGYMLTTRSGPELLLGEGVKVTVISSNDQGNASREIGVADALTPGGS